MTDEQIEPELTMADRRVLRVVPAHSGIRRAAVDATAMLSLWQLAEALEMWDLVDLDRTLSGLHHLGYLFASLSKTRRGQVFCRSAKGDAALAPRVPV